MEVNKLPDFQKCGEILIDVKSKNKRNKTYMFHCTFCDMKFNELKKFSLHIGEEHFNDFDDIVAGIEVKTETEEIQAEAFAAVKKSDPKVDVEPKDSQVETFTVIERPDLNDYKTVEGDSTNLYPMHLVNAVDDHLNFEVKNELMDENEESIFCDAEVNAISESDKEATEEVSVYRTSADTSVLFDSDSDADKTPMKKIKLDLATQDKKAKKKTINNETNCDESKEGDCNNSTVSGSSELLDNEAIKQNILSGTYKLVVKTGRSKVWDAYAKIEKNGLEIQNRVGCRKCFSVLKYDTRSTSNLVKHKCYANMRKESNQFAAEVNSDMKKEAARLIFQWCIDNCRPFQIVEDSGLKRYSEFLVSVGAKYGSNVNIAGMLPHPTTLSRNIKKIYETTTITMKNDIDANCTHGYGLTSDIWTDNYLRKSYISLTINYIRKGQLVSKLLGLNSMDAERCTNDVISSEIKKMLQPYNCSLDDGIMVSDSSSNMVAAFSPFLHINCINHLINNVIEKAVKQVKEVEELFSSCSKAVKYLKKSGENDNSSSTTRWNTVYYLLDSVQKNWMEIDELQEIENININHVKGVLSVLKPFQHASEMLEAEKCATLHLVYSYVNGLLNDCMPKAGDIDVIKRFKKALRHHLQTTVFSKMSSIHKIAHFLFPPANKLLQFTDDEKEFIKQACAEQMRKYSHMETDETDVEQPSSTESTSIISKYFKSFVMPASNLSFEDKIDREIRSYQNLNVSFEENFDVINWWHMNQMQLPILYKLSCKILATPASSAASERVFSIARQLLSEKGTSLFSSSTETFNQIMFLNLNADK